MVSVIFSNTMMTDPPDVDKEVAELSELERVQILSVLHRDEILRTQHQLQMMRLKGDLQLARRKGALKCGVIQSGRSCSRCRAELGRIINRGAFCRACRHRVCKSCREYSSSQTTEWVCTVCFKHMELTAASGEWINDFVHRPNKRRDNRISAAETVRHSIQRSWTFSDASPSPWSALRGSPELRAYSSMPRHVEDCDFIPRTLFTNRLNLTNKKTATPTDNIDANESKNDTVSDKESDKEDKLIEIKINDNASSDKEIMDKTSDSEPSIIDEHLNAIQTTDNDSSIGSPLIDKRSYSESTSVDNQSSIGSPITDKRFCSSPLVDNTSCSGSPVVEKRNISDSVVEPLTGTVFRKVTLRKRRVDTRNLPPGVTPPRSRRSLRTNQMRNNYYHEDYIGDYTNLFLEHGRFFVPDGEDYKLVFISSSDSSSREELQSDDNSSTSSGLLQSSQLDECDWDYFESSCTAVVKPWVNNSNNGNNSGGKENNTEKTDLNNENVGGGDGNGEEGEERQRQQQTETEETSVSGSLKEGNAPPPVRVVVPHRPPESQATAQVKLSEASGLKQCGPISCVPVPIPVPIPVPFPILIPIPWQPDLTIRIQHSLAPVWSNLVSQQLITVTSSSPNNRSTDTPPSDGSIMTEQADDVNKKEENTALSCNEDTPLPASELQPVDELLCNKAVSEVIVNNNNGQQQHEQQQQQSDNVEGVVLKMYKTLDDNYGEVLKKDEKSVDSENYSNDSDSSTTSEDENEHEYVGKIKRRSGRRIYRFNRADTDSETSSDNSENDDDDESSGEFSMGASPPSSAASSDECIGDGGSKHFKKIFVVNDSDSDIGELPEYNDSNGDEVDDHRDGEVTLLKHVKHADNVKLSSILNDADELNENRATSPRFIDLKSVLNDVKCGKTGSSEESDINSASGGELVKTAVNDSSPSSNLEPVVDDQEAVVCQPTDPVDDSSSLLIPADSDLNNEQQEVICKLKEEEETRVVVSGETADVGSSGGVSANGQESSSSSSSSVVVAGEAVSNVPSSGGSVRDVERTLHDESVNNDSANDNVVGLSLSSELLSEREDDKSPEVCDNSIIDNVNKTPVLQDAVNSKSSDGVISNNSIENRNFIINEFLTNEIDFCNKMNSVNSNNSYIYTSTEDDICDKKAVIDVISDEELGKSEGTRGSNTSDEFSGTESMELEQQGQIRSSGPVTCVEATSGAVAGESCKETARYTSLVMITQEHNNSNTDSSVSVITTDTTTVVQQQQYATDSGEVHVVTGRNTLSAVVCLEDGLPDDDSWVEDLDRDDFGTTTEESSDGDEGPMHDREEELRGYHRAAIDFTLHTIVEESCEESEVETDKNRPTELEKYFFYGLGDGTNNDQREMDTMSETSSIYSEGLESLGGGGNGEQGGEAGVDPAELASSRLEKYFLAFNRRDSDGSVGSDSEGRPSPEQRRKRLVRARGTGRQQSSSLDNLTESEQQDELQLESEGSSTETDSHDEQSNSFEKNDGQFDTVKRTKKKKRSVVTAPPLELLETQEDGTISGSKEDLDSDDGKKTPQPEFLLPADLGSSRNKQQSRDSGFMGSCDDLLKESRDSPSADTPNVNEEEVKEASVKPEEKIIPPMSTMSSAPPATGLTRKDSFNNWSSDEETNLMMSKMRAFFKTMVGTQPKVSSPNMRARSKPPQLVYFESELTRLMKTVPGIRDEQVREIVEYLSSEDTWSDSYDSSDYTSSDLEGGNKKTALQEEISASCRQIISNFETQEDQLTGADSNINKDTAFVYQRLVASFSKIETPSSDSSTSHSSPPLIAKVMQHIGSRLVALMHEVSGGEGGSPKASRYHRRLQPKLSTTSTTEDEEDSIEDYSPLPRSKSHDPLIEENRQEASDNERFSWRGSFESALMASDSRTRLASGGEASASALALAAKRRSAGDLLFKSCSREQLDRVRSCGSIGGSVEDKIWGLRHPKRRRSSVPDSGGSNDGDDDSDEDSGRSTTLPRSLQTSCAATNSLPRLPTSPTSASPSIYKAHSVHQFNVKSARYRPPGYSTRSAAAAVAPPRRDPARRRAAQTPSPSNIVSAPPSVASDDASVCSEPVGTPRSTEEDVDRLLTQTRATLGARSDSLASVYSGAGEGRYGSVAVRGEVEFGLQYNYKQGALEIHVKQCRDLAPVDIKRNRSDPYVKVYLLPDKSKSGKRKTKVKKHTLNPVFEETLKFHITLEGLESRTLWLSVWHSDMFGRNDFLGEVTMALENKVFDDPMPRFYTLQERSEPLEELLSSKGELIVGLKFVPPDNNATASSKKRGANKGSLHVLVKEAKNLAAVKSNGTSDPFCKSYLLPDKGRSSKQKTPVSRRSCSPAWNHTFVYHGVSITDLPERSLELTIWDHDRLASNEFLGGVRLNLGTGKHNGKAVDWMDSSGKETVLWQRMLERPNLWVESCLPLRPSLDVRSSS